MMFIGVSMAHLGVHTETLIVNTLDCQLWIFMIGHVDRSLRTTNMDWWWIIIGVIWQIEMRRNGG
jgi:hypothetical protein